MRMMARCGSIFAAMRMMLAMRQLVETSRPLAASRIAGAGDIARFFKKEELEKIRFFAGALKNAVCMGFGQTGDDAHAAGFSARRRGHARTRARRLSWQRRQRSLAAAEKQRQKRSRR